MWVNTDARKMKSTVVSALQIVLQSDREIADTAADIEQAMLRPQASADQLRPYGTRTREGFRIPGAVVINPQVCGRQQRTAAMNDTIERRREPVDTAAQAARQTFPRRPGRPVIRHFAWRHRA